MKRKKNPWICTRSKTTPKSNRWLSCSHSKIFTKIRPGLSAWFCW